MDFLRVHQTCAGKTRLFTRGSNLNQTNPTTKITDTADARDSLAGRHSPRDHSRNVDFLVNVSNIFAKSLNIQALFEEVTDQIFHFMKRIDRVAILFLDKDTGELREVASKSSNRNHSAPTSTIRWNRAIAHRVIKEGNALLLSDKNHAGPGDSSDDVELDDILSVICVPLRYEGEIQGVIYVDSIALPNGIRKDDLQLLTALGDTAAMAIQNARSYEALKRELDEHRRAEEALTKANRELRETRDMLVQSEKLAAIGRLSAAVAHEILNPVHIMSMRIQLLEAADGVSESTRKSLHICKSQLNRIVTITENLGRSSRTSERHTANCNLNETIQSVLDLISPQLREDEIHTEVELHAELPLIPMDKERIEQVILNLISNAAEAMAGQKAKTLTIRTRPSDSKGFVRINVSDTGTGIDRGDMDKVFDPFFTTKAPGEGTGLGLFISYGIIQEHAGRIWAEKNEPGGASFNIELPIRRNANQCG
jgi:signal transduction histidine kinase